MVGVDLRAVVKSFGATEILKGIDLEVEDGEFFVLVGPSGCGKSTLLRIVAGLEEVDRGDVLIGGARVNDLPPARRGVAMVFQSYALYPHMTVRENMAFGLRLAGTARADIDEAVGAAAELLEVAHLLDRRPRELSGGQRQRVAIGRAIVRQPKLFLFDEPLSNLDAELRVRMRYEFARLHRRLGTTTLYVTHDQVEAMTLADRIAVLDRGAVAQVGTPGALYEHPATLFVAGFIGSPRMNFLAGTIAATGPDGAEVRLADGAVLKAAVDAAGAVAGAPATLGVRPEHLRIGEKGLAASATLVESLGNIRFVYLDPAHGGEPLVVQLGADEAVAEGAAVRLTASPGHCHLFDAEGRAYRRIAASPDSLAA